MLPSTFEGEELPSFPVMPRQLDPLDDRIPRWNDGRLTHRTCPFCQSEGVDRFLRPDGLHVRHCSRCGCYFVSPSPAATDLDAFYTTYYTRHRHNEHLQYTDPVLVREMFALDPLSDIKARTLASLLDLRGKRVLDVGCGMGQNLLFMKKLGAEVAGIDLDPDSVEFATKVLGLTSVHRRDLLDLSDDHSYDLIMLHDVIEHPLDPLAVLTKSKYLLAPRGLLSIWTPNVSTVENEDQPIAFRVDLEHMQYLTFDTCCHIATVLGMTIVSLGSHGLPKLKSIRNLSDEQQRRTLKQTLRGMFKSLPGFVQLNTWRKKMLSSGKKSGDYHLFCVFRNGLR